MLSRFKKKREFSDKDILLQIEEEIAFIASHKLKNPLTAFSLQIRILNDLIHQQNLQDHKDQIAKIVQNNEAQVQRMEQIINRLIILMDKRFRSY